MENDDESEKTLELNYEQIVMYFMSSINYMVPVIKNMINILSYIALNVKYEN